MKEIFLKTTITSVMAITIIGLGFILLFCISFLPTQIDAALRTQIVQGDWNIMSIAALFYFGQSKDRRVVINDQTTDQSKTEEKSK